VASFGIVKAPAVKMVGRLFFFSSDRGEPPHVHVARDRKTAKFWLHPVQLEYNLGFAPNELSKVLGLIHEHRACTSPVVNKDR
jgi:hypothetical protein